MQPQKITLEHTEDTGKVFKHFAIKVVLKTKGVRNIGNVNEKQIANDRSKSALVLIFI